MHGTKKKLLRQDEPITQDLQIAIIGAYIAHHIMMIPRGEEMMLSQLPASIKDEDHTATPKQAQVSAFLLRLYWAWSGPHPEKPGVKIAPIINRPILGLPNIY